jgi:DNA-binding NtrC family response regulator
VTFSAPATDALTPAVRDFQPLKVTVASGPDFGRELLLEARSYRVGKAADCDLVLTDRAVSSTHLIIEPTPSGVRLADAGSTNGTFYRGARVETMLVQPPAVVRVGRTELRLEPRDAASRELRPSEAASFGGLLGASLPMRELYARLERVAPSDADVLIHGETGTGKELCARAIHAYSARRAAPFETCDLGALNPTLAESELFGHVRGAFTGAVSARAGVFERADGGTVFLDEIAEMPLEVQPLLLRVLEQREVKRLGGNTYTEVDVRVIAASHHRLAGAVAEGRFREDLQFRLAALTVELPPLRERAEDVPVLIDAFLKEMGKSSPELTRQTLAMLCDYAWPGNVRELRNVVERVVNLGVAEGLGRTSSRPLETSAEAEPQFKAAKDALVDAFERDYLERLLKRHAGNITRAAQAAGITRVYLQKLMKKHRLREQA